MATQLFRTIVTAEREHVESRALNRTDGHLG